MKISKIILAFLMLVGVAQADVQSNIAEVKLTAELKGSKGRSEERRVGKECRSRW